MFRLNSGVRAFNDLKNSVAVKVSSRLAMLQATGIPEDDHELKILKLQDCVVRPCSVEKKKMKPGIAEYNA